MEYTNRKLTRLKYYDYRSPGGYFITICTKDRKCLFWKDVGAIINRPDSTYLSHLGKIVQQCIMDIETHYPAVRVDQYTVMPNHIHLLLQIQTDDDGRLIIAPTISTVVKMMKREASKQIGWSIWQRGFHDHVIRGEKDYQKIWEYIQNNPVKWTEDCFYSGKTGD